MAEHKEHKPNQMVVSKKSFYIFLVAIVLIIAILVFYLKIYPEIDQSNQIKAYKKAVFNNAYCQYSCPLTPQIINNKTQMLPDKNCTKVCIDKYTPSNETINKIKYDDLVSSDEMIKDFETAISNCQSLSVKTVNGTISAINSELFVNCAVKSLESLKANYTYLN